MPCPNFLPSLKLTAHPWKWWFPSSESPDFQGWGPYFQGLWWYVSFREGRGIHVCIFSLRLAFLSNMAEPQKVQGWIEFVHRMHKRNTSRVLIQKWMLDNKADISYINIYKYKIQRKVNKLVHQISRYIDLSILVWTYYLEYPTWQSCKYYRLSLPTAHLQVLRRASFAERTGHRGSQITCL